jgi:hypothetical protein
VVIMEAAVRRVHTWSVIDDLRDPRHLAAEFVHDLEIAVMGESGLRIHQVPAVRDEDLQHPRRYLNRLPHGTAIVVATDAWTGKAIDAAIRGHRADEVTTGSVFKRTGWAEVSGDWGFLSPSGFMTSGGLTTRAHSQLIDAYDAVRLRDLAGLTDEHERAAARNTLDLANALSRRDIFTGLFGPIIWSIGGHGVGAVPFLAGVNGSGKSTIAQGISAHIASAFSCNGRSMGTVDGSVASVSRMGAGLESFAVFADDSRKRTSRNESDDQAKALDRLIRPGYAGGHARHTVASKNPRTGEWEMGVPDLCSPAVILIGEQIPDAEELDSTRERLYPMVIPPGDNAFVSGNSQDYEALADNGLPSLHIAFFIRWCAAQIEEAGMDGWKAHWATVRELVIKDLSDLPVSRRVIEVASLVLAGNVLWLAYLSGIGAITREEENAMGNRAFDDVRKTAEVHGTTNVKSTAAPSWVPYLDALRAAVAGNTAYVQNLDPLAAFGGDGESVPAGTDDGHRKLLGIRKDGRGGNGAFIAMQPRDMRAILRTDPKFRDVSDMALRTAFAPVAITDKDHSFKMTLLNGLKVATIAVPLALFTNADGGGA